MEPWEFPIVLLQQLLRQQPTMFLAPPFLKAAKASVFKMTNPVKVFFRKDGRIDINLDVSVKKGESVGEICTNIQNSVADALFMMCEAVPFSVHIKVSSLSK